MGLATDLATNGGAVLTVGSLFTGIGGFDLGLERAGMRVVWQCESDPFCRRVLARHWPEVPCFRDVRDIEGPRFPRGATRHPAPRVDVLCGGFPCQDISSAGKRAGIDGARSGLWAEYARLVGELRPRYVVVENVSALLSGDRGAWMGRVLGDLAALGYDAEWDCIPASAVGAPHRRDRVWIVAYPQRSGRDGWPHLIGQDDSLRDQAERRKGPGDATRSDPTARACPDANGRRLEVGSQLDGESSAHSANGHPSGGHADGLGDQMADAEREGLEGRSGRGASSDGRSRLKPPGVDQGLGGQWQSEPDVGRVAHGVSARVDRLRSLGNALVPQIAEWIGRRIVTYEAEIKARAAV